MESAGEYLGSGCGVLEVIFGDLDLLRWPVSPEVMVGDITQLYTCRSTVYMYSNDGRHYCTVK